MIHFVLLVNEKQNKAEKVPEKGEDKSWTGEDKNSFSISV